MECAASSRAEWRGLSEAARAHHLKRVCSLLVSDLDVELAQLLDLEDEDLRAHTLRLTCLVEEDELCTLADSYSNSELLVVRPDWRQLFLGFETTLAALFAGCPVVVIASASVPQLARALARAAESAGLPKGVLCVLHDDGLTAFRAMLSNDRVTDVFVSADREGLAELDALVQRHQRADSSRADGFGAGVDLEVEEAGEMLPRMRSHSIQSFATVVRPKTGLRAEADRVLEESLGRFGALDGLLDGCVRLALCPEREFSRFTAELLAQLKDLELPSEGPLALDSDLSAALTRARERGLDEGATLLQGSQAAGRGSGGSLPGSRRGILVPTIFTNVEEHMQLVRDRRPAPLLCLMRVASEEAGDELAARLDAAGRA